MIDPDTMQAAPCQADDYVSITPEASEGIAFFLRWMLLKPKTARERFLQRVVHVATWMHLARPSVMARFVSSAFVHGYVDGFLAGVRDERLRGDLNEATADVLALNPNHAWH